MARTLLQRVISTPVALSGHTYPALDNAPTLAIYTDAGHTTLATVYADATSGTTTANPITADANGIAIGWLDGPTTYYWVSGVASGVYESIPSSAGSVAVRVDAYGYNVGTGGDDSAALGAALAALPGGMGTLSFSPGKTYHISGLTIGSGVGVMAQGATIVHNGTGVLLNIQGVVNTSSARGWSVIGGLWCANPSGGTTAVIKGNGAKYGVIADLEIQGSTDFSDVSRKADYGLWLWGRSYLGPGSAGEISHILVSNVFVHGCTKWGFFLDGWDEANSNTQGNFCNENTFIACRAVQNGTDNTGATRDSVSYQLNQPTTNPGDGGGIYFKGCDKTKWLSGQAEKNQGPGLRIGQFCLESEIDLWLETNNVPMGGAHNDTTPQILFEPSALYPISNRAFVTLSHIPGTASGTDDDVRGIAGTVASGAASATNSFTMVSAGVLANDWIIVGGLTDVGETVKVTGVSTVSGNDTVTISGTFASSHAVGAPVIRAANMTSYWAEFNGRTAGNPINNIWWHHRNTQTFERDATGKVAVEARVIGEANARWQLLASGTMYWGPGGGSATDVGFQRINSTTMGTTAATAFQAALGFQTPANSGAYNIDNTPSGLATSVASNGTITPSGSTVRVTNSGNITGVILATGSDGQVVTIFNEGSGSITFAAVATSHVANGVTAVIPTLSAATFRYNSNAATPAWYKVS